MSKRVTIMIDLDLDKLIRKEQAQMIVETQKSYSYSKAVNNTLRKVLLK